MARNGKDFNDHALELIGTCEQTNSAEAWRALWVFTKPAVLYVVNREKKRRPWIKNPDETADELTNDVILKVIQKKFNSTKSRYVTWVNIVSGNLIRDMDDKHNRPKVQILQQAIPDGAASSPDKQLISDETVQEVRSWAPFRISGECVRYVAELFVSFRS